MRFQRQFFRGLKKLTVETKCFTIDFFFLIECFSVC